MLHWCWTTTYVLEIASKDWCWLRSLMGLIWQLVLCVNREAISQKILWLHQNTAANKQEEDVDTDLGGSQRWECRRASLGQWWGDPGRDSSQPRTEERLRQLIGWELFSARSFRPRSIFYNLAVTARVWPEFFCRLGLPGSWADIALAFFSVNVGGKNIKTFRRIANCCWILRHQFSSVQSLSRVRLCNPMNRSTPGLLSVTNSRSPPKPIHWVGDAIQPSHPLLSPSPPVLNLSQHQGLFKRVSSSHQVAKVLEFQLQHQSYQWTPRTDLL